MSNYQAENIGRIIAAKRKEKGLTQEGLANLLQITPQAVSKWENGVGLPDVTLIPRIANALGVTVSRLFGETEGKGEIPEEYKGLPFIVADGKVAVYSTKSVASKIDTLVTFSDGSTADLIAQCVVNMGPGEVRIVELGHLINEYVVDEGWERDTVTRTFADVHSLDLRGSGVCEMKAICYDGQETVVEAEGSKRLLARLAMSVKDGLLAVEIPSAGNNNGGDQKVSVLVKCPFSAGETGNFNISGCGEIKVSPAFRRATVHISGCGTINLADTEACDITVSGSGEVNMEDAKESLSVRISGSGSVACANVGNLSARISGSGDIAAMELSGDVSMVVSGSGSVSCSGGQVNSLTMNVNGSGSLAGGGLTVENAELNLHGGGTVTIGRIKGKSVERLSKDAHLVVKQRG